MTERLLESREQANFLLDAHCIQNPTTRSVMKLSSEEFSLLRRRGWKIEVHRGKPYKLDIVDPTGRKRDQNHAREEFKTLRKDFLKSPKVCIVGRSEGVASSTRVYTNISPATAVRRFKMELSKECQEDAPSQILIEAVISAGELRVHGGLAGNRTK